MLTVVMPAGAANEVYVEVATAEDLKNNLTKYETDTNYTIVVMNDISDFSYVDVVIQGNITLTTPQNTNAKITWSAPSSTPRPDAMLKITNGGNLVICDNSSGELTIKGNGEANAPLIYVGAGSTLTITGGCLTGNTYKSGAAVHVDGGSFAMSGGTMENNIAHNGGESQGVVYVWNGDVVMSGGSISYNEGYGVYVDKGDFTLTGDARICANDGGVRFGDGTFTMSGGTIEDNTEDSGVLITNNGNFVLSGGTIDNNTATGDGGGVYISGSSTFEMSGGTIRENDALGTGGSGHGGGVYITGSTGRLSGGIIEQNTAKQGGGVYIRSGTLSLTGTEIRNNKAFKNGGGVYLGNSGLTFSMSGKTKILGNHAKEKGGGIYSESPDGRTITINGGEISGNSVPHAGFGGGVYVEYNQYGSLELSGLVTITGNTRAANPSNFYLCNNQLLTIKTALSQGSKIGVTTEGIPAEAQPIPVTVDNTKDYTQYFVADNQAEYHIEYNEADKRIVLAYGVTKYNLKWDLNGGTASNTYTKGETPYDSDITQPQVSRDGYTFAGWSPANPPQKMPANDLKFTAVWKAIPEPEPESQPMSMWIQGDPYSIYTVTFENGGTANFNDDTFYSVVMPQGYVGDVTLTTKSDTDDFGFNLHKKVDIAINKPMPSGGVAIIKCKIALADVQAQGFTAADVAIYHFENGVWVKLATVCEVRDGIVYTEAETQTFSPFALGFGKGGAVVPTEIPDVEPTETPESPAPILGMFAGLCFAGLVKRRG